MKAHAYHRQGSVEMIEEVSRVSEPAVDIAPVEVGLDPADAMAQAAKEAHEREMMGEMPQDAVQLPHHEVRMSVSHLDLFYGDHQALKNVNIDIREREITSFIGPSGCGKSTLLRCLNRMNDYVKDCRIEGKITLDGRDIYRDYNVTRLRQRVGMVFQRPNPFPKSIFENVAYGLRVNGVTDSAFIRRRVEEALRGAALWDEVKDKLKVSAYALSGGQQQRLCIARAMAVSPSVLLMDEPASALDPISTAKVEELIHELKKQYTIVIVTHNMQQAARVSDSTAFFYMGEMVEFGDTKKIFTNPDKVETQNYITGRFG